MRELLLLGAFKLSIRLTHELLQLSFCIFQIREIFQIHIRPTTYTTRNFAIHITQYKTLDLTSHDRKGQRISKYD